MTSIGWDVLHAFLSWLSNGVLHFSWWQIVIFILVMTHITMISVSLYLHRYSAHRAMYLHPAVAHFFRFWLWMTTGMETKAWTAIHRKHHAKCEQAEDPHSPVVYGIKTVLLEGAELYRKEAKNEETMRRYGHGTPQDWMERHVYSHHSALGVTIMLVIDLLLFGVIGLAVWAVQMVWTPMTAAGIVNGWGHYGGYRNFESPDASTNVSPIGILIAGEELHNNHHTYPTSAKFSVKPYEFDIGWMYINILRFFHLASVKKIPPKAAYGGIKPVADEKTLELLIVNRYELMARYAKSLRQAAGAELMEMKRRSADSTVIKAMKHWMRLERGHVAVLEEVYPDLQKIRAVSPMVDRMISMREELRQFWLNTTLNREQLALALQGWCQRAESSGISWLKDFSLKLRSVYTKNH